MLLLLSNFELNLQPRSLGFGPAILGLEIKAYDVTLLYAKKLQETSAESEVRLLDELS